MKSLEELVVSVVMATYNGAEYLHEQLGSIEGQTRAPDELIIVDDCSSDNTRALLQEYAQNRPWVKLHFNERNLGVNGNFSKALALATGDVVFFSDQDDVWLDRKIELFLTEWDGEDLLYSDGTVVASDLSIIKGSEFEFHCCDVIRECNPWFFFHSNCVSGHSMMLSRRIVDRVFPMPDGVVYDQWCAMVASLVGSLKLIPEKTCFHRMHLKNAVNNPELRKKSKRKDSGESKRGWQQKKRDKLLDFYESILKMPINDIEFRDVVVQLAEHYRAPGDYFNFELFMMLYKNRNRLYSRHASYVQKLRSIRNHCMGSRMLWLTI